LYSSPTILLMELKRMGLSGHVARMTDKKESGHLGDLGLHNIKGVL